MQSSEYLQLSEKTLASNVDLGRNEFKTDFQVLFQSVGLIQAADQADAMKRSLFYKDPKIKERLQKATVEMESMFKVLSQQADTIKLTPEHIDLLHAVLGIFSEAGEVLAELIKSIIEGRPLDTVNLKEEAGDLQWYNAIIIRLLGSSYEEVFKMNIDKLSARYPDKFTTDAALNRDLDVERTTLENSESKE